MTLMLGRVARVHLVGIGGAGMSGIAEILLNLGFEVSGSDLRAGSTVERLRSLGAQINVGHKEKNVIGADVIARSSAVNDDNPEVQAGRRYNIPVISRSEILTEIMRLKYPVAVAGTHGKTTTASFLYTILATAGLEPTAVIGGKLSALTLPDVVGAEGEVAPPPQEGYTTGATLGDGDYFIVEADESDGTFLDIKPAYALVTNIDEDHLNYYGSLAEIQEAFVRFANSVPFYGATVVCLDDPAVQDIIPRLSRRYITYGFTTQCDVLARELRLLPMSARYKLYRGGESLGEVDLSLPGRHNVLNSLAAAATALEIGVEPSSIIQGLRSFKGIEMRLQNIGNVGGVTVLHDYAHHPTEIEATLEAIKSGWTGVDRRITAVFQPHRYTRTQALFERFLRCFYQADRLIVTDIYSAGEPEIAGVSARELAEGVRAHGHRDVVYIADRRKIPEAVVGSAGSDELILVLGAGNIWETAREIVNSLRAAST